MAYRAAGDVIDSPEQPVCLHQDVHAAGSGAGVYPENAKGQQGTVVLELLIGRDGSVQDAKFLQGSLAFARAATDAVRQWRFKPYTLNTHPASVRTVITLNFRPAS